MAVRPLHDWVLIEIEEDSETFSGSSIIRVSETPIRIGKVIDVGKGKNYKDKYVPTVIKKGEYVAFFMAATQTQSGAAITHTLDDGQYLIRETDILVVGPKDMQVSA